MKRLKRMARRTVAPLIVGSMVADFFRAGTNGRNGNIYFQDQVIALLFVPRSGYTATVFHQPGALGDR